MIPQSITSLPSLKGDLSDGCDKLYKKYKNQEKRDFFDKNENKRRVSMKNRKNESEESIVHWKQKNIKDGFVIVDEAQLSKLIKREPIEKFYKLEQEPFATGLFASVRRCQSLETGESYAAKFSSRARYGEDCSAEIYHEIALLSLCGSAPRVIQIHDVFENEKEIILVMEYAPGGDLQTIIDENLVPFESDVMSFVKQTVEGLEYLHRRRIAHLDIKPQNIVMMGDYPNCEIKLCDFEISRVILEGNDIRELLGTPDYVAPEILHYDPITLAADMWSLGVTTYVLLTGFSPFGGETDQETFCNISRAEVDFPEELFKDVSNDAIDFVKSLLVKNPKARLSASECLKHPWLNGKIEEPKNKEPERLPLIQNEINLKQEEEEEQQQQQQKQEEEAEEDEEEEEEKEVYRRRNGCETCQAHKQEQIEENRKNDKALRKYLSKSREALFEKVVQKHNNNNNNIRKNTIKNHRFRKTRLCESQISLISKSQEKLLTGETFNAPSRSIEKLYGLRSLSKSQEVLNLYKNGGLLASQENLNLFSELIKSRENLDSTNDADSMKERRLMRATTADLGILHQRHKPSRMYSCSSTTSLASLTNNMQEEEENEEKDERVTDLSTNTTKETNGQQEEEKKNVLPKDKNDNKSELIKEIEKLEERRKVGRLVDEERDGDEPRFTVAQLIMAYNKHQEIVTKTSLEVTMSAQEKKVKIPPIIPYKSNSPFPTGPTALRLFIPDIDLVEEPKKFNQKYKIRLPEATPDKTEADEKTQVLKKPDPTPLITNSDQEYLSLDSIINNSDKDHYSLSSEESITPVPVPKDLNKKPNQPDEDKDKEKSSSSSQQRRSKSSSPITETNKTESTRKHTPTGHLEIHKPDSTLKKRSPTPNRKVSTGKTVDRSPSATRKSLTVERSPASQRRSTSRTSKQDDPHHRGKTDSSSHYKIVGIGDKTANSNRKPSGVSYKIEFDSPVVTRKFPIRNTPTKGTISSNLKMKETTNRGKK